MNKKTVSFLLSFIFVMLIAAPTTIMLIEKSYDVSVFFSLNEEENSQNEISKKLEVNIDTNSPNLFTILELKKKKIDNYYNESYSDLALDNFSPPPELV